MSEDATSRDLTDADIHGSWEKPSKQPPLPNRRTLDAFDATEKSHNHPIQPTTSERSTRGELHGGKPASKGAQGGDEKHKTLAYAPGLPPPRRVSRLTNNVSMEVKDICNTADTSHSVNRALDPRDRALEEYAVKTAIRIATGDTDGTKGKTLAYAPARAQSYALSSMDDSNSDDQEAPQREIMMVVPGAYAVRGIDYQPGDDSIEPSMHTMSNAESQDQTYVEGIEAELARTDSDIEERIMERLKKSVPVAVVKAESQGLEDSKPPSRVNADEIPRRNKKWWIIGVVALVLILGGVGAGVGIALSGGGNGGSDPEPTSPPDIDVTPDSCLELSDTSIIACYKEDIPSDALITFFFDCPSEETQDVFECQSCGILLLDNAIDIGTITVEELPSRLCNGCMLCGTDKTVAYDCTNIAPEEACAFQDCSGDCGKDDPPSNSAETQPDECLTDSNDGTFSCYKEGEPTSTFITQFQDCPDTLGFINVFECGKCVIIHVDNLDEIDREDTLCNSCLVCGSTVAFDCSNVAPNNPCAVTTCDGACVG